MAKFLEKPIFIIIASLLAQMSGEFFLAHGMQVADRLELSGSAGALAAGKLVFWTWRVSPFIYTGIAFYTLGFFTWLIVLNRVEISVAYPMLSLNFVFTVFLAPTALDEPLNAHKLVGVLLIVGGIAVLSRGLPKEER